MMMQQSMDHTPKWFREMGDAASLDLYRALKSLVSSDELLQDWISKPNAAFESRTPKEIIRGGDVVCLWEMIAMIKSGHPI
jgi:hypothetical protein